MKKSTSGRRVCTFAFSLLTTAVLSLPAQAAVTADNISGKNSAPPAGGGDWIDTANKLGLIDSTKDSSLSVTAGSSIVAFSYSDETGDHRSDVLVTGTGSLLKILDSALFGIEGASGHVTISQGGTIEVSDRTYISGYLNGSSVVVTDTGSVLRTGRLQLGHPSATKPITLSISNGGLLETDTIQIERSKASLNIGSTAGTGATRAGIVSARRVDLVQGGTLVFNHTDTGYTFAPAIQGDGNLLIESGETILSGQNDYHGTTTVSGGKLLAGAAGSLSAHSAFTISDNGYIGLNGYSQTTGAVVNAGVLDLSGSAAGTLLTVNGNYTGQNGTLIFGSALGDDHALSDRLVITGNATGTSRVRVNNLGGKGAETLNGIKLIEVQGNADSSAFTQEGRIVAGAWDYRLVRGNRDWYLTSRTDLETGLPIIKDNEDGGDPGDGGNPGDGDNPGDGSNPGNGGNPGQPGGGSVALVRPEAGAYAANLAAASALFDTRMSDRQGSYYRDPDTGETRYTSLWLRMAGDHNRVNAAGGQLHTRANNFVTMLGGDVLTAGNTRFGLMAGYGNSKSSTQSVLTGYRAGGQVNGYTTGVYGTWLSQGNDETGLQADTALQYSWFTSHVNGQDMAGESYKSDGISASAGTGYVIPLGTHSRSAFFLQPQARAAWSGIKADDHTERNGTRVQSSGQDNVRTSLGVKALMKGPVTSDSHVAQRFSAYAEANWIHNTRQYGVRMDGISVAQQGSRNMAELRLGLDGTLDGGIGVKGSVGQQTGGNSWSDTSASISVSYHF